STEIENLRCFATRLEIDFVLWGFDLPENWMGYVISSNLPGAAHDVAYDDEGHPWRPAVTGILTNQLQAGKAYYATLWWIGAPTQPEPEFEIAWVPSYWGMESSNPAEALLCKAWNYSPGWCVFGHDGYDYFLTRQWFQNPTDNWGWLRFTTSVRTYTRGAWTFPTAPGAGDVPEAYADLGSPPAATEPPPLPVIKSVKRRTDHVGTYQLYAATKSAVTEAWWRPGEGVQATEVIHISQDNIVGFDKVNEPDGTTQSLYTAVPDGVWETWWRPGEGLHHNKIVTGLTGVRQIIADPVTDGGQYTHRLYLLASDGPYEVWWREGGDGIHVNRLDIVNDPVTMTKSRGPDGTDQLYVATPTWVYELWWRPNTAVNHGSVINITQGDIRSLDKGANLPDGGQLLYTGTSTTAWQTYWNSANGTGVSHGTITVGQTNAGQIKKTVYNGDHQLYQTNGCRVQENWWNGPNSGSSTLINISQCNITSFDKSADGPDQQVYTASGDLVYETWWRGGSNPSGPNTSVLFKVAR
ncbi:MAG TPA: hypothetical protein VJM46_04835, partial [Candidatus Saccharimonadales bacterium]|nr:hypothetical protein [Candidatus Saccharimonadales bacterium]